MENLERYLDQVCRSMGGPRSLRQHVRQELREHLLDAVAEYQAAGASAEVALERAMEEFGKSDDVRHELEGAHGQRMMAVLIDKAMQWKEKTMKAKWLWVSWANVALALVIALEALFIAFTVLFITPKFQALMRDRLVDLGNLEEQGPRWMVNFLLALNHIAGHYTLLLLIVPAIAWCVFEWRVRSENKTFMRLSALGTAAVALTVVVILMSGSLVVCFCLGVPANGRMARFAAVRVASQIEQSLGSLEQAAAAKDWEAMPDHAEKIKQALHHLTLENRFLAGLINRNEPPTAEELGAHVQAASDELLKAQQDIRDKNADGLAADMRRFRKSFEPVRDAAKRIEGFLNADPR